MLGRLLRIAFVAMQLVWMLVILPGHLRGQIVLGGGCSDCSTATTSAKTARPSCCEPTSKKSTPDPQQDRRSRCAVCNQAHGYTMPPVFDFDLAPTGLCELCRLIEPSKRHLLLCRPTYFATAPPVTVI